MLATFVLYLREGIEASLIISILFATLRQLGQVQHARAVWSGIALAILASIVGGFIFYFVVQAYDGTNYEIAIEAITFLIAAIIITAMTFWMQQHSRTMKKEIMAKATTATSGLALGALAFSTVGREGIETAIFTIAFAFSANGVFTLIGGALGLLVSVGLAVLIYRLGYRLNYRIFFRVMGILLIFFAAGLLSNAIGEVQEAHWLTFASTPMWDLGKWLGAGNPFSDEGPIGATLHGLLGYTNDPTYLQGAVYVAYLLIVGGIFTWMTRKPSQPRPEQVSNSSRQTMVGRA